MSAFSYQSLVQEAKATGGGDSYDPIPDGNYGVEVEKAEAKESKKGDPQLVIVYRITDDGPFKGRKFWQYMTFIPGNGIGLAINFRQLDNLGATPLLEQGASLAQVGGFLLGKRASVRTEQRSVGDKVFNDVKDVKAVAGGVPAFNPQGMGQLAPPSNPAPASNPF